MAYEGYASQHLLVAGGRFFLLPGSGGMFSLAPQGGEAFVVEREESLQFAFYEPVGSMRQTWLVGVAGSRDRCAPRGIHAYDPITFERRFSYELDPTLQVGLAQGLEIAGRVFVLVHEGTTTRSAIVAFDARSGSLLWSRANDTAEHLATDGALLFFEYAKSIAAVDPASGETKWSLPVPEDVVSRGSYGERFAAFLETTRKRLWIVEHARPEGPRARFVRTPVRLAFVAAGGDVYLEAPASVRGVSGAKIVALDLATGAARWAAPAVPCGSFPGPLDSHLAVAGSTLYACTCDGIMRRFDRATGRAEGELGVGDCSEFLVLDDGSVAYAEWRHDDPAGGYDAYRPVLQHHAAFSAEVVERTLTGTVEFSRGATPGRRTVRIGAELVRTDARGRFSARVRGRGMLSANAAVLPGENAQADYRTVVLSDPGNEPLTLPLERGIDDE